MVKKGSQARLTPFTLLAEVCGMNYDEDRVDDAVLALMYLTIHDRVRSWKGFDWDALNRLHEKGFIADPKNKTKSVVLTEEGLARSEELFELLFSKRD